jgi:hypothetical protein
MLAVFSSLGIANNFRGFSENFPCLQCDFWGAVGLACGVPISDKYNASHKHKRTIIRQFMKLSEKVLNHGILPRDPRIVSRATSRWADFHLSSIQSRQPSRQPRRRTRGGTPKSKRDRPTRIYILCYLPDWRNTRQRCLSLSIYLPSPNMAHPRLCLGWNNDRTA